MPFSYTPLARRIRQALVPMSASMLILVGSCMRDTHAQVLPSAQNERAGSLTYVVAQDSLVVTVRTSKENLPLVRQDGPDILFSFPDAVPMFDAAALQFQAADWVEGVSVGYDSLLLRLAKNVTAKADIEGGLVHLRFSKELADLKPETVTSSGIASSPTDSLGALRLRLLRAQLMLHNQELTQARGRFNGLRSVMPGRPEPVLGLAAVEWQAGKWRQSLDLYQQAAQLGPETPDVLAARETIARSQASRLSVGLEERRSHGGTLTAPVLVGVTELKLVQRLSDAWRLNLEADFARVRTDAVRRAAGTIESFSGQRSRGFIAGQHDALSGNVFVGSIFFGEHSPGIGLSYRRPDDSGSTYLVMEGRRDNWDYVEGLVDGAARDRLALGRTQRFSANLGGRLEVGANRYYRKDDGQLGRSATLAAELRLNRLAGIQGFSAAYQLNGEYVSDQTTKTAATGESYSPLPLVNREVHSLTLGYFRSTRNTESNARITFDGYAGIGSDRYGKSGEIVGASLSYSKGPVDLSLRLSHVRNVGRSKGTTDSVTAVMTIFF
jgi:hypothetical protein